MVRFPSTAKVGITTYRRTGGDSALSPSFTLFTILAQFHEKLESKKVKDPDQKEKDSSSFQVVAGGNGLITCSTLQLHVLNYMILRCSPLPYVCKKMKWKLSLSLSWG